MHPRYHQLAALEADITTLAAHINAATFRLLTLIAQFDALEGWADAGCRSCAHWLNWKCGIGLGAAREKVRVANALASVPLIRAAFQKGEISYSKVRAMTRVATPETEAYLLMIAQHGTASHVETLVRKYRQVACSEETAQANEQFAERTVTHYYDEDGTLVIKCRLAPEQGVLVIQALDAAADYLAQEAKDVSAETLLGERERLSDGFNPPIRDDEIHSFTSGYPRAALRADGLCLLAEQFLAQGPNEVASAERYQVMLHVDTAALRHNPGGRAELERGPCVSAETSRRVCCDTSVVAIHEDAKGNVLDVGRKTRTIHPALRRALRARDAGCRFPGCTAHRYVDAHHIQHWADGGKTALDNLVLLCRYHHRLLHEGGYGLAVHGKELLFTRPDGEVLSRVPSLPRPESDIEAVNEQYGLAINADTAVTLWDGVPMDHHMAVHGLLYPDPRFRGNVREGDLIL